MYLTVTHTALHTGEVPWCEAGLEQFPEKAAVSALRRGRACPVSVGEDQAAEGQPVDPGRVTN